MEGENKSIYSFHICGYDNQKEKNSSLENSLELGLIPATFIFKVSQIPQVLYRAILLEQSVHVNPFRYTTVFQQKDFKLQSGLTKKSVGFPHTLKTPTGVFNFSFYSSELSAEWD